MVKRIKSNWNIKREKSPNITVRFGNMEATSEGDLDVGSLRDVQGNTSPTRAGGGDHDSLRGFAEEEQRDGAGLRPHWG